MTEKIENRSPDNNEKPQPQNNEKPLFGQESIPRETLNKIGRSILESYKERPYTALKTLSDLKRAGKNITGSSEKGKQVFDHLKSHIANIQDKTPQLATYLKHMVNVGAISREDVSEEHKQQIKAAIEEISKTDDNLDQLSLLCVNARYLGIKTDFEDVKNSLLEDFANNAEVKNNDFKVAILKARLKYLGFPDEDGLSEIEKKQPNPIRAMLQNFNIPERLEKLKNNNKWMGFSNLQILSNYLLGIPQPLDQETKDKALAALKERENKAKTPYAWKNYATYAANLAVLSRQEKISKASEEETKKPDTTDSETKSPEEAPAADPILPTPQKNEKENDLINFDGKQIKRKNEAILRNMENTLNSSVATDASSEGAKIKISDLITVNAEGEIIEFDTSQSPVILKASLLSELKELDQLEFIDITRTELSSLDGIKNLKHLKELLTSDQQKFTKAELSELRKNSPDIDIITVPDNPKPQNKPPEGPAKEPAPKLTEEEKRVKAFERLLAKPLPQWITNALPEKPDKAVDTNTYKEILDKVNNGTPLIDILSEQETVSQEVFAVDQKTIREILNKDTIEKNDIPKIIKELGKKGSPERSKSRNIGDALLFIKNTLDKIRRGKSEQKNETLESLSRILNLQNIVESLRDIEYTFQEEKKHSGYIKGKIERLNRFYSNTTKGWPETIKKSLRKIIDEFDTIFYSDNPKNNKGQHISSLWSSPKKIKDEPKIETKDAAKAPDTTDKSPDTPKDETDAENPISRETEYSLNNPLPQWAKDSLQHEIEHFLDNVASKKQDEKYPDLSEYFKDVNKQQSLTDLFEKITREESLESALGKLNQADQTLARDYEVIQKEKLDTAKKITKRLEDSHEALGEIEDITMMEKLFNKASEEQSMEEKKDFLEKIANLIAVHRVISLLKCIKFSLQTEETDPGFIKKRVDYLEQQKDNKDLPEDTRNYITSTIKGFKKYVYPAQLTPGNKTNNKQNQKWGHLGLLGKWVWEESPEK